MYLNHYIFVVWLHIRGAWMGPVGESGKAAIVFWGTFRGEMGPPLLVPWRPSPGAFSPKAKAGDAGVDRKKQDDPVSLGDKINGSSLQGQASKGRRF